MTTLEVVSFFLPQAQTEAFGTLLLMLVPRWRRRSLRRLPPASPWDAHAPCLISKINRSPICSLNRRMRPKRAVCLAPQRQCPLVGADLDILVHEMPLAERTPPNVNLLRPLPTSGLHGHVGRVAFPPGRDATGPKRKSEEHEGWVMRMSYERAKPSRLSIVGVYGAMNPRN